MNHSIRHSLLAGIAIGAAVAFACWPFPFPPIERAEQWMGDFFLRAAPKPLPSERLAFVAIDESSMNLSMLDSTEISASPALELMATGWPFSREVYALLAERLLAAGARVVVFDISFPMPGRGDDRLAEVVRKHPGKVVLAGVLDAGEGGAPFFSWPSDTILDPPFPGDKRCGFANFFPDSDGVVRDAVYSTTLSELAGKPVREGEERFDSLAGAALRQAGLPVPPPGNHRMRFSEPGAFPTFPLWMPFVDSLWQANLRGGGIFRNKIVLVGPSAPRFGDAKRSPLDPLLPGPELHLNALSAAIMSGFIAVSPAWSGFVVCLFGGALAGLLVGGARRSSSAFTALFALPVTYLSTAFLALAVWHVLPPLAGPSLAMLGGGLGAFFVNFASERRARAMLRKTFERYVSRDIVRELLDNPSGILGQLGGARRHVVVLFSDLRGFTALTENADPAVLVGTLNEYLGRMVDAIFSSGGTVDKFIGDAVMAVWGAVASRGASEDAAGATHAAGQMLRSLAELNEKWAGAGQPALQMGIGIHSGEAVFGNMGSPQKMEPTVIGDTVNLASRLEGLAKKYGVPVILSGEVAALLGGRVLLRRLDRARVVGRSAPVEIYALPIDRHGRPLAPELLEQFEHALTEFSHRRFDSAADTLRNLTVQFPEDLPARLYLDRCTAFLKEPPPETWAGVTDWLDK